MITLNSPCPPILSHASEEIARRTQFLLRAQQDHLHRRTDRLFAGLMALQWLASVAAAVWIAPRTWEGLSSRPHPHLWIALFLGGAISLFPIALAIWYPGRVLTRHIIAIGQMLMSGLLIHLTGGRLETHFHVFGSLAFLAFYRDWRVLVLASAVTAADHGLRGMLWPQSIFGTAVIEPWHWMEHVGWVVFTDIFLFVSIAQSMREMRDIAWRHARQEAAEAELQQAHDRLEERVQERTEALARASNQNQALLDAAGEGIYGVDKAGLLTFINPKAAQILGYTFEELQQQPLHNLLHHTRLDGTHYLSTDCPIYAALHDGIVHHAEDDVFWHKNGSPIPVDYVSTPVREDGEVVGAVVVFRDITERKKSKMQISRLNAELEQRLDRIVILNHELAEAYDGTIEGWSKALDLRDHETEGHSQRVTEMTLNLAQAYGISEAEWVHIRRGALLHDIGKMGIPDCVLLKPGPLTIEEWSIMRMHPTYAYEMLSEVAFVRPALEIPYCHHEMWDGQGYPRGLQGEEIPLAARLFAVVDVWDALRSDRPYRRAWSVEKTCAHIESLAGTHFDPQVVDVFLRQVTPLPVYA